MQIRKNFLAMTAYDYNTDYDYYDYDYDWLWLWICNKVFPFINFS